MVLDQLPEAFTRAVLVPANSTLPLEKERLTVAPATPVPVMVKLVPVPASMFEMMSSAVMASIVGGGTVANSTCTCSPSSQIKPWSFSWRRAPRRSLERVRPCTRAAQMAPSSPELSEELKRSSRK